jgi:hypothetical protein
MVFIRIGEQKLETFIAILEEKLGLLSYEARRMTSCLLFVDKIRLEVARINRSTISGSFRISIFMGRHQDIMMYILAWLKVPSAAHISGDNRVFSN